MRVELLLGDCTIRMDSLPTPEGLVDTILCDPPYEIGFMSRSWDNRGIAFSPEFWSRAFAVLKPGGTVKAFSGTRTFHRMAAAMAKAGFSDIHINTWGYGSGFPKSLSLSKALDKQAGAKRGTKRIEFAGNGLLRSGGQNTRPWMEEALKKGYHELPDGTAVTDEAKAWDGWGTALKPAWEPVLVGRKPLVGAEVNS